MKEYLVFEIWSTAEGTEENLNSLALKGWIFVGAYAKNNQWLIMEREKQV